MSAKRFIIDSGGTARKIKNRYVVDAGGVTRKIKKRYAVDAGGVTRLVWQMADDFTMNCAEANNADGFATGGFGSLTPNNVLGDGNTVQQITVANHNSPNPGTLILELSGAGTSSQSYLTSISLNGSVLLSSAASFVNGQWTWTGAPLLANGEQVAVEIIRS